MAGTVIDSLVVQLGLDGSNYKQGAADATASNKKMRDDAETTAKSLVDSGKQGAEFFGQISKKALEFFAIVAAGRGMGQLYSQAVSVGAATGRMAQNIGTSVSHLSAWQNMMGTVGQSADDATSSLNNLAQQQAAIQMGQPQNAAGLLYMRQMTGISYLNPNGTARDPSDIAQDLAPYFASLSGPVAQAQGKQMGFTPGFITAEQQLGAAGVRSGLANDATNNEKSSKAAQDLQASFANLEIQVDKFSTDIMTKTAPAMVTFYDILTKGIQDLDQALNGNFGPLSNAMSQGTVDGTVVPNANPPSNNTGLPDWALNLWNQEKAESGGRQLDVNGNPITSSAGAVGIMQLMPSTAEEVAKKNGIPWDPNRFKYDAGYNQNLGLLYMQQLEYQFPGNPKEVYAAYNAGPKRVQDALDKYGPNWLSHMPDATQAYVAQLTAPWKLPANNGVSANVNSLLNSFRSQQSQRNAPAKQVSVGDVHIHTAANTVKGLSKAGAKAIRQSMVTQANTGFA